MGGPAVGESCWLGSTPDHEQAVGEGLLRGEAGCGEGLQERAELELSLKGEPGGGGRPLRQQGRERWGEQRALHQAGAEGSGRGRFRQGSSVVWSKGRGWDLALLLAAE